MDLATFKTRVIEYSAVMAIGQVISNAIAHPATQAPAGIIRGRSHLAEFRFWRRLLVVLRGIWRLMTSEI